MSRALIAATFFVLATGCASTPATSRYSVDTVQGAESVVVTATVDESPLPGVEIQIYSARGAASPVATMVTGPDGTAVFSLPSDRWRFHAAMDGLVSAEGTFLHSANSTTVVRIELLLPYAPEAVVIGCPPPFWDVHAPGTFVVYHNGDAWPKPWWY
jgi:hypothetical protein